MRLFGIIDNTLTRADVLLTPPFDLALSAPPPPPEPDPVPETPRGYFKMVGPEGEAIGKVG